MCLVIGLPHYHVGSDGTSSDGSQSPLSSKPITPMQVSESMRQVRIVSGCSGSGKSVLVGKLMLAYTESLGLTFEEIRRLPKSDKRATCILASADTYFIDSDGKYTFDGSKLSEAHGACFKTYIEGLQNQCQFIVVDNTNTTAEEIAPYILGAQAYGYEAEILTIIVKPSTENVAALKERNRHGVSSESIVGQMERLASRRLPPWWKNTNVEVTW